MTTAAQTAVIAIVETFIGQAAKLAKRSKFSSVHSFVEGGSIVYRVHRVSVIPPILSELVDNAAITAAVKSIKLGAAETLVFNETTQWFEYSIKAPIRS